MDGHRLWRLWKPCEKHALMVHKRLSCAGGFDCRQTLLRTEVNFVLPCTTQGRHNMQQRRATHMRR